MANLLKRNKWKTLRKNQITKMPEVVQHNFLWQDKLVKDFDTTADKLIKETIKNLKLLRL